MADSQGPSAGELAAVDLELGKQQREAAFRVGREAMRELVGWQRARRYDPQINTRASVRMAEIMQRLSPLEMQALVAALVQQLEHSLFEQFGSGEDQ